MSGEMEAAIIVLCGIVAVVKVAVISAPYLAVLREASQRATEQSRKADAYYQAAYSDFVALQGNGAVPLN